MTQIAPLNSSLPVQNVSYKKKFLDDKDKYGNTKWMKDNLDAGEAYGMYTYWNNNMKLKKNYDIMSGRFDIHDYIDDFEVYDLSTAIQQEMQVPGTLKHYDITSKYVKLLLGESLKRPDITRVVAKDSQTSNEKLRLKTELLHNYIQEAVTTEITNKLKSQGLDPEKSEFSSEEESQQYKEMIQQKYQEYTPQSIEKYLTYDYRSAGEHWGQATLSDDIERFRMKEQDTTEFYDMCVVDRCFSHLYLTPSGYKVENWNPTQVFYQYNTQNLNIEDGGFVGRMLYMSRSEVLGYMGHKMYKEQIEALYPDKPDGTSGGGVYKEFFKAQIHPFADWKSWNDMSEAIGYGSAQTAAMGSFSPGTPFGAQGSNYMFNQSDIVQVTQMYWKSMRKIGKINIENPETGESIVQIVDETFQPKLFDLKEVKETFEDSTEPNTICWTWINEVWGGIKININYSKQQDKDERSAIYIDIKPTPFQFRGNDPRYIWESKLPVCGSIFNNRNGTSQSVVDLLKPYQIMHNAFMNQAYQVGQKGNGKFFVMGASMLPSIKDWGGENSQEKLMATAQTLGLVTLDDSTQGQLQSMQYGLKAIDMDESDRITRLINLAMMVEQQGAMQIGITPQRQGAIQASETATGTDAAINNSYAVTEIYFEQFSNYRRRKLQMMLELAQFVESQGEGDLVKQYTTSDLGQAFIHITKADLLLRNMGVYIENSAEMQRKKALIEQLILKQNQQLMPLSKLIETVRLESLADIQKKLEEQEAQTQKQQQAAQEAERKHAQEMQQAELEQKQLDRNLKKYEIDTKANTELQKVTLQGISNEGSFNPDVDKTDQLLAERDIALKESQSKSTQFLQQQELAHKQIEAFRKEKSEKQKAETEKNIKESEQRSKHEIELQKLEQIRVQNASQEKINKESNDAKIELANKAIQIKELEKKMKEMEIANSKKKSDIEISHLKAKVEIEKDLTETKVKAIEKITDVKLESTQRLANLKSKEAVQASGFKMKENEEKHKENLKKIKIKPKIKK